MDHYLSTHPDIFVARKEMHFFGADLSFGTQFYRRDEPAYLAEFEHHAGRRRAGETSVWYLYSQHAAAEIKAFSPDARIVIMLREPTQMLYSLYYTFLWDGNENIPTFEEALAAEEDRRVGRRLGRQTYFAQGLVYRDAIRYTAQVKRYFDIFGRDNVRVIIYDDFATNTAAVYRDTLSFLGADPAAGELDFRVANANQFVKNRFVRALLNDRLVRSGVLAVRPLLPRAVFSGMQKIDARIRRLNSRTGGRPVLSSETRWKLKREFAPEVERLSELLDRDLTSWSREDTWWESDTPGGAPRRSPNHAPCESRNP